MGEQSPLSENPVLSYGRPNVRPRICARTWIAFSLAFATFLIALALSTLLMSWERGVALIFFSIFLIATAVTVVLAVKGRGQDRIAGVGRLLSILTFGLCAATMLLAAMTFRPTLSHPYDTAYRVKCASNLRQIGQACLLYANDNSGQYPDSLARVLATQDLGSEAFCCPNSKEQRATGATTQAIVADFLKPGRCSYVYLGAGMTDPPNAAAIVTYEPLSNHDGDGMTVLFGDGTVTFVPAFTAKYYLSELAAGHNPPRPATKPAGR